MKQTILAICDPDETYLRRLDSYLREHLTLPLSIIDFTDASYLESFSAKEEIAILIIAEAEFHKIDTTRYTSVLILRETPDAVLEAETLSGTEEGMGRPRTIRRVFKYQPASRVVEEVCDICTDETLGLDVYARVLSGRCRLIGYYSPVKRALQTTLALTTAMLLAKDKKALYLSMEPWPCAALTAKEGQGTLMDLLYYHDCNPERLMPLLARMTCTIGTLHYIPANRSYLQLAEVTGQEWRRLIKALCEKTDLDYLLLDLSETVQELPLLLSMCHRIYTVTERGLYAAARVSAYRAVTGASEEAGILDRTTFAELPVFKHLPQVPEDYPSGALASHILKHGLLP